MMAVKRNYKNRLKKANVFKRYNNSITDLPMQVLAAEKTLLYIVKKMQI